MEEAILENGKNLSTTKIKFCLWDLQPAYIIKLIIY